MTGAPKRAFPMDEAVSEMGLEGRRRSEQLGNCRGKSSRSNQFETSAEVRTSRFVRGPFCAVQWK